MYLSSLIIMMIVIILKILLCSKFLMTWFAQSHQYLWYWLWSWYDDDHDYDHDHYDDDHDWPNFNDLLWTWKRGRVPLWFSWSHQSFRISHTQQYWIELPHTLSHRCIWRFVSCIWYLVAGYIWYLEDVFKTFQIGHKYYFI